ncbi:hypothetical protein THAOC_27143 [Thalassiosira oceanica]|uniref:Uncharacterized protein n=1 Tax=Thalassiosira oceanica TaxID=159749 RepID=K0RI83_THAOC|nr:hypothetical protein THAOC_27143 [Thalassiosira oceanica]|eukprot:EJK53428.1 hypothetical protein THAOC_27143 [Thalassiosira oceanica]
MRATGAAFHLPRNLAVSRELEVWDHLEEICSSTNHNDWSFLSSIQGSVIGASSCVLLMEYAESHEGEGARNLKEAWRNTDDDLESSLVERSVWCDASSIRARQSTPPTIQSQLDSLLDLKILSYSGGGGGKKEEEDETTRTDFSESPASTSGTRTVGRGVPESMLVFSKAGGRVMTRSGGNTEVDPVVDRRYAFVAGAMRRDLLLLAWRRAHELTESSRASPSDTSGRRRNSPGSVVLAGSDLAVAAAGFVGSTAISANGGSAGRGRRARAGLRQAADGGFPATTGRLRLGILRPSILRRRFWTPPRID